MGSCVFFKSVPWQFLICFHNPHIAGLFATSAPCEALKKWCILGSPVRQCKGKNVMGECEEAWEPRATNHRVTKPSLPRSLSLSLSLPLSSNPLTACQATERWDPGHTQVLRWQHLVVMVAHLKCNSTLQADAEQSAHTEWTLNNFMKSFYPMGAFKKHTAVWAPHTPRSTFTGGHTLGPELERTLWHKLTGFGATEAPGFIRWFIIYLIVDRRLNRTNRGNQSWAVCNYWLESPGHVFLSWPVIHPSN